MALTTTLEETENYKYLLEKENLRLEKELNVFKNKHANLKILIQDKNDLLAHYGARNVGKREKYKQKKMFSVFSVFIKISKNDNVGYSRFYIYDWPILAMSVFPVFSVQVVFEFVSVGKTLVEMLYGYVYDIIFCWNGFADSNMEVEELPNICLQISVSQWC